MKRYASYTLKELDNGGGIEVKFDESFTAGVTRALLLAEGRYTPKELGLIPNPDLERLDARRDILLQSHEKTLALPGMKMGEFHRFYERAWTLIGKFKAVAKKHDAIIASPTVFYGPRTSDGPNEIYPEMEIDYPPRGKAAESNEVVEDINSRSEGFKVGLTEDGRRIDISPDLSPGNATIADRAKAIYQVLASIRERG